MIWWCLFLAVLCQATLDDGTVFRVRWSTNQTCVAEECGRLDESSASFKLISKFHFNVTCATELCGVAEFQPVPFTELAEQERAIVMFVSNMSSLSKFHLRLPGDNLFAIQQPAHAGKISLFEYGMPAHIPIDLSLMQNRGLPDKSNNNLTWELNALLTENPNCVEVFQQYSLGMKREEEEALLERCAQQDQFEEDNHFESNNELFVKAHDLGLISDESLRMGKTQYLHQLMDFHDPRWISISWVPVFESYHGKLGHGQRSDALLLELIESGPHAENTVVTRAGKRFQVKHRRFVALITCQNDDLDMVIKCIKHELGLYVYRVEHIVWGLGFVGDYFKYSHLEPDWNADPIYTSNGEMLPRNKGEKQNQKKSGFFEAFKDEL